jgi:hypothetical protein
LFGVIIWWNIFFHTLSLLNFIICTYLNHFKFYYNI